MGKKKSGIRTEPTSVIETFRDPRGYTLDGLVQNEPSAFNGHVRVHRFRVSVELIPEPDEVIHDRLEKLWVESDNHHDCVPLEYAAHKIGYAFNGKFGEKAPKRR